MKDKIMFFLPGIVIISLAVGFILGIQYSKGRIDTALNQCVSGRLNTEQVVMLVNCFNEAGVP